MKILNVAQNYRITGGSDRYFFSLESLLREKNHVVIPYCAAHQDNSFSEWSEFFPPRVDFQRPGLRDILQYVYSWPARKNISDLIEYSPVDIAHLHIYYGQLTSSILTALKDKGIPTVQTLHEYKIVCPVYTLTSNGSFCKDCRGKHYWHAVTNRCNRGSLFRSFLSAIESYVSRMNGALSGIDHFIAVSDFLRDQVVQLGVPAEKVTTVHNFIDASGIEPSFTPGEYFLYFGRIESIKGVFTLVEAFRPLRNEKLLFVGTGSALEKLREIVERDSLDHIYVLGFKSGRELEDLIRRSICTITPSEWYETFGLTLVESFAFGRPVIASRIGGMPEVVSDGIDGHLFNAGDILALRESIVRMAANRKKAAEFGRSGREKVLNKFNPDRHYRKIMSVYEKVLGK